MMRIFAYRPTTVFCCLILALPLLTQGCRSASQTPPSASQSEVTMHTEAMTLPWHTSIPVFRDDPNSPRALYPVRDSRRPDGERTFETVVLENRFIRVQAVPEAGGVIARAIHKPLDTDFFFFEEKAKDYLPWWESGVKVSFPFYEHGLSTEQEASWLVFDHEDGSRTLAMWMEFSRHQEAFHARRYGRFSTLILTQQVRLHPDDAAFTITYGIINPTPYRQGRRLWNDTFLPRNHTAEGVIHGNNQPPADPSPTRWIFPTTFASDHWGIGFGPYDPAHNIVGERGGANTFSVFAWNVPHGFAGAYYPEVDVNRLRLTDPVTAPGVKQWYVAEGRFNRERVNHMYNFLELWGGTDHIFEGIENWIAPGERFELSFRYAVIHGIGEVHYANDHVGIHADFDGEQPQVRFLTLRPRAAVRIMLGDLDLGTYASGPDQPTTVALPQGTQAGRIRLLDGSSVLLDRSFPLELCDSTDHHDMIWQAMEKGARHSEMSGNADEHGRTARQAIGLYPNPSLDRGRVLYRDGRIEEAITDLRAALDENAGDGEGMHLLGAALLEAGQFADSQAAFEKALTAEQPYPEAGYFLAVRALADGQPAQAAALLKTLIQQRPNHWEARLLLAALSDRTTHAQSLTRTDPADLRAWYALYRSAGQSGETATARSARHNIDRLLQEEGAAERLEQFRQTLEGRWTHPRRLKH